MFDIPMAKKSEPMVYLYKKNATLAEFPEAVKTVLSNCNMNNDKNVNIVLLPPAAESKRK